MSLAGLVLSTAGALTGSQSMLTLRRRCTLGSRSARVSSFELASDAGAGAVEIEIQAAGGGSLSGTVPEGLAVLLAGVEHVSVSEVVAGGSSAISIGVSGPVVSALAAGEPVELGSFAEHAFTRPCVVQLASSRLDGDREREYSHEILVDAEGAPVEPRQDDIAVLEGAYPDGPVAKIDRPPGAFALKVGAS